ncbi:hypothetical protein RRF57_001092 [Xylaria bambusicola]|uniref:Uncharacterized protein n=1 Tax=Xylaria bambusicola TaxID=326684 RepID=A0AAN7UGN8_9PEZI
MIDREQAGHFIRSLTESQRIHVPGKCTQVRYTLLLTGRSLTGDGAAGGAADADQLSSRVSSHFSQGGVGEQQRTGEHRDKDKD